MQRKDGVAVAAQLRALLQRLRTPPHMLSRQHANPFDTAEKSGCRALSTTEYSEMYSERGQNTSGRLVSATLTFPRQFQLRTWDGEPVAVLLLLGEDGNFSGGECLGILSEAGPHCDRGNTIHLTSL